MTRRLPRSIVFWSHRDRPSFKMRGRQVVAGLTERGHDCRYALGPAWWSLRGVRDAIIVCVKSEPANLSVLRERGNCIVWDAIDYPVGSPVQDFDAVLCASVHVKNQIDAVSRNGMTEVFYHHADSEIRTNEAIPGVLRLAYVGEVGNSLSISGKIPELCRVNFKKRGWQTRLKEFNGHFSARLDPGKSVVKLANSAAANAVFVTGREPGVVELLGADYPFFLDSLDEDAVAQSVRQLAGQVGSSRWLQALERMEHVKRLLTLNQTVLQYESLFHRLLDRRNV